jgi:hypothetical protein
LAVSVARAGLVDPNPGAIGRLWPLPFGDATITGGFWAERLRRNRERTIPHGFAQLDRAGNFHDLPPVTGRVIPDHLWSNREPAGMRVWIAHYRGAVDGSR